jgi:hypothetical protein
MGRDSSVSIATCYGLNIPGIESRGARFSVPVQKGPWPQPASYTMGTGSFPEENWLGRGVEHLPPSAYLLHGEESLRSWPVFAASQEIPPILWNPKVLYLNHKCPPPVPILSQLHRVPTTPSNFLKNHLNIILPSTSGPLSSVYPTNTLCTPLSFPIRATCPAHLILLDLTTRTILCKEYRSFSFSLCNFLHSTAEVKERVDPYLCSPCGPSWPVLRWTLLYFTLLY